jgi:serine/threonine-protein kinase
MFPDSAADTGPLPEDPLVGSVICGRYRVEKVIGTGGMGSVYRAVHVHMRKTVALKVLHGHMTSMPEAVARFEREAVAAGRIKHRNVAAATDFGRLDSGDAFYLALDFVEGQSLRHVMHNAGAMPTPRAVGIIRQVVEALEAAHALDIVHRDLKPENIMLQNDGPHEDFVKVLDFGLAKIDLDGTRPSAGGDPSQLTRMGSVFGTPTYMSPEQSAGNPVDHRSDLYAAGVLLYEMLAGEPPFEADAIVVVLSKHINEAPPPLPAHVDPRLARIVMRLLEKAPEARPQSASLLLAELDATRLSIRPLPSPPPTSQRLARVATTSLRLTRRGVASVFGLLRRSLSPVAASGWRALTTKWPKLTTLERRVHLGGRQVSLGGLLSWVAALFLASLSVWALVLTSATPNDAPEYAEHTDDVVLTEEGDDAASDAQPKPNAPPETELQRIEALPVYKRKLADWLSLGAIHAEAGDWSASTAAYRNAIQLDRGQTENPKLLGAVRIAAEQRASYEAAILLSTTLLGERGMDLIYDVWLATKNNRKQRLITELAYKKLEIRRLGPSSKPLRVCLDLEFARSEDCAGLEKILERAIRDADQRSVPQLTALKKKGACALTQAADCRRCKLPRGDLDAALETARELTAPKFSGGVFVPGK